MSVFSDLPHDVLMLIAIRLKKLEDFVSFSCVSKSLIAAAKDEYFEGLRFRPYLLLPVRNDDDDHVRDLYSIVEGESIVSSIKVPNFNNKKCLESLGWLLVSQEDGNTSLLEPLSGMELPLPHQNTFSQYEIIQMDGQFFFQKMALSSRPNEDSNFVLMVVAGGLGDLGFWRLGDKKWKRFSLSSWRFKDVVYLGNDKFYAIGIPGVLWVFDFAENDRKGGNHLIMKCDTIVPDLKSMYPHRVAHRRDFYAYGFKNLYVLKSVDDALLVVTRIAPNLSEDCSSYITTKFQVFEVDIAKKSWKEIHSLGRMAVFLGHNSTIALDATRSGGVIKPNHIYYTEDDFEHHIFRSPKGGGMDIGVYNLETGTVEPFHLGELMRPSRFSCPLWINSSIQGIHLR